MRFAIPFIAVAIAFSGTTARAQAVSGQPSFHLPGIGSTSMDRLLLRPAHGPSIRDTSEFAFESIKLLAHVYTCPMPVAPTDSGREDPMPVARGGTPVPMPVAKSGCSNPLGPER